MVMTVSLVPIFAADQINNTSQDQVQNQTALDNQTTTQEQLKNCTKENGTKIGSCDCDEQHKYQNGQKNSNSNLSQHKYQYGQKNTAKLVAPKSNTQKKYQYGLKNVVTGSKNCNKYQNCLKS
jgi:transcriptional regulator of heat shock response